MNCLEGKLADKIITQQELEAEIKNSKFQLDYTKYEIDNLKDAIIEENEKSLEDQRQEIENLKEALN